MGGPDANRWAQAMTKELDHLEKNATWTLVPRQDMEPGHCALGKKWIYKLKQDADGNIARFKAK